MIPVITHPCLFRSPCSVFIFLLRFTCVYQLVHLCLYASIYQQRLIKIAQLKLPHLYGYFIKNDFDKSTYYSQTDVYNIEWTLIKFCKDYGANIKRRPPKLLFFPGLVMQWQSACMETQTTDITHWIFFIAFYLAQTPMRFQIVRI